MCIADNSSIWTLVDYSIHCHGNRTRKTLLMRVFSAAGGRHSSYGKMCVRFCISFKSRGIPATSVSCSPPRGIPTGSPSFPSIPRSSVVRQHCWLAAHANGPIGKCQRHGHEAEHLKYYTRVQQ